MQLVAMMDHGCMCAKVEEVARAKVDAHKLAQVEMRDSEKSERTCDCKSSIFCLADTGCIHQC